MTSPARDPRPDTLFGGTLTLHQPARGQGYRVNVDAVLLAFFAGEGKRVKRTVDLGAGVGALGLCLLYRDRTEHVVLVERDVALSALSKKNLEANGWQERGESVCADVTSRGFLAPGSADLVVCNPPYFAPGRGRVPAIAEAARVGELAVFTDAARHVLGTRGRACFVYPAPELATLFETLRGSGLEPKRMRFVHARRDQSARIVLVEAMHAKRGGLHVLSPISEHDTDGPSAALTAILAARD